TVGNCTFSGNSSPSGGGLSLQGGAATVNSSTFTANSAGSGGGISNNFATLVVGNCTFSANSPSQGGGLQSYSSHTLAVGNCTFSANSGGGISSDVLDLQNTIVAGNRGSDIEGLLSSTSSNNLVGLGDRLLSGITNGVSGNLIGSAANPIDPRLGPLADNGGP